MTENIYGKSMLEAFVEKNRGCFPFPSSWQISRPDRSIEFTYPLPYWFDKVWSGIQKRKEFEKKFKENLKYFEKQIRRCFRVSKRDLARKDIGLFPVYFDQKFIDAARSCTPLTELLPEYDYYTEDAIQAAVLEALIGIRGEK